MSKFKVGDKVVVCLTGEVIAVHQADLDSSYPVMARINSNAKESSVYINTFTLDGKNLFSDDKPSLFTEQELQLRFIAKLARFKNPHGQWLTQSPKGMWFVHKTKPVVNGLGNAWFVDWADYLCVTEAPDDFSKQIFQLSDILTDDN